MLSSGKWKVSTKWMREDRHDFLVASVTRDDTTLIPTGRTRLQAGDRVYLICLRERLDEIYRFCGLERRQVDRVMILGGSKVAVYLARMLERKKVEATLIENDAENAERLAEELDMSATGLQREAEPWQEASSAFERGSDHTEIFKFIEAQIDSEGT